MVTALGLILVSVPTAPAYAAAAGPTAAQGSAPPTPPAVGASSRDTARSDASLDEGATASELDARVRAAFEAEDYASALVLLERAYAKTKAPRLLFNLGAVHHHLAHCEAARDFYREYSRHDPPEPGRGEAQAALRSLEPFCGGADGVPDTHVDPRAASAGRAASPSPPVTVPEWDASSAGRAARGPRAQDVVMWSLLGAGAAAGTGALFTWRDAARAASDVEDLSRQAVVRARAGETYDVCCRARGQELERSVERNEMWSRALGVTSAMLVGSGLTLWLLRSEADSISVQHGGHTGLVYRTIF